VDGRLRGHDEIKSDEIKSAGSVTAVSGEPFKVLHVMAAKAAIHGTPQSVATSDC
jgi:hypothetical protein